MNICAKCRIEMDCIKTGTRCVFGTDHVYAGDTFRCRLCDAQVVRCNDKPYHDPHALTRGDHVIRMEEPK